MAPMADLVVHNAGLVATVDENRRELPGGWVAITDGLISSISRSHMPGSFKKSPGLTQPARAASRSTSSLVSLPML